MVKLILVLMLAIIFMSCTGSKTRSITETVNTDTNALYQKYHLDKIKLPPGFVISVYAEVPNARSITLSPNGILYVGNRDEDKVYAVVDENKDGIIFQVILPSHAGDRIYPNGYTYLVNKAEEYSENGKVNGNIQVINQKKTMKQILLGLQNEKNIGILLQM